MSSRSDLVAGSLVLLALLSVAVVAEAEANYATVTNRETATANVAEVTVTDDGSVQVRLGVENTMNEPLRVAYVHLELDREHSNDAASTPFGGYRTLPPGRSELTAGVTARQLSTDVAAGERITIRGRVAVSVYNNFRFDITIEETAVTL